MNHNRRKTDNELPNDIELHTSIQLLTEKVSNLISDSKDIVRNIESVRLEVKGDLKEFRTALDSKFVTKDQFDPVRKLVFGFVGIALTALVVAILAFIIRHPQDPPSYPRDGTQEQIAPELPK